MSSLPSGLSCCRAASAARAHRRRRRSARPSCPCGQARSPDWRTPSICRRRPCRCRSRSASGGLRRGHRDPGFAHPGDRERGGAQILARALALLRARPVASAMIVATPFASLRERIRVSCGRPVSGSAGWAIAAHIGSAPRLATVFRARRSYIRGDEHHFRGGAAAFAACSPTQRALGAERRRTAAAASRRLTRAAAVRGASRRAAVGGRRSARGECRLARRTASPEPRPLRRRRRRRGLPGRPDRSLILWAVVALRPASGWSSPRIHSISPGQRGVVTRFGRYSRTLGPGVSFTLPSPIERVTEDRRRENPHDRSRLATADDLMLTGDQNLLDLAYSVRWNIRTSGALPVPAGAAR